MIDKKPTRRAVIFLMLFALPFAGGGTFVGYLAGSMLVNWARAGSWVEVPARILHTDLDVNHGDDSTTYRVEATYEYTHMGTTYVSDRVTFGVGSDNIGSFHEDKYRELRDYVGSGDRFRCFVNPDDPTEAVLYRELRWGKFGPDDDFHPGVRGRRLRAHVRRDLGRSLAGGGRGAQGGAPGRALDVERRLGGRAHRGGLQGKDDRLAALCNAVESDLGAGALLRAGRGRRR